MAKYQILLTKSVQKKLDKLDNALAEPLLGAIDSLAENPRPNGCIKLRGRNAYRIRHRSYRVIYEIIDDKLIITVVAVGHRKDVY